MECVHGPCPPSPPPTYTHTYSTHTTHVHTHTHTHTAHTHHTCTHTHTHTHIQHTHTTHVHKHTTHHVTCVPWGPSSTDPATDFSGAVRFPGALCDKEQTFCDCSSTPNLLALRFNSLWNQSLLFISLPQSMWVGCLDRGTVYIHNTVRVRYTNYKPKTRDASSTYQEG